MTGIERKQVNARMSKIVRHRDVVYLCGQTARGVGITDIAGQRAEVLARIDALLAGAGTNRSRPFAASIHLKGIGAFAATNAVWEAWVPAGCAPARTTVEGRLAAPELLVEITALAAA